MLTTNNLKRKLYGNVEKLFSLSSNKPVSIVYKLAVNYKRRPAVTL